MMWVSRLRTLAGPGMARFHKGFTHHRCALVALEYAVVSGEVAVGAVWVLVIIWINQSLWCKVHPLQYPREQYIYISIAIYGPFATYRLKSGPSASQECTYSIRLRSNKTPFFHDTSDGYWQKPNQPLQVSRSSSAHRCLSTSQPLSRQSTWRHHLLQELWHWPSCKSFWIVGMCHRSNWLHMGKSLEQKHASKECNISLVEVLSRSFK